jgi:hypothetical protein
LTLTCSHPRLHTGEFYAKRPHLEASAHGFKTQLASHIVAIITYAPLRSSKLPFVTPWLAPESLIASPSFSVRTYFLCRTGS